MNGAGEFWKEVFVALGLLREGWVQNEPHRVISEPFYNNMRITRARAR